MAKFLFELSESETEPKSLETHERHENRIFLIFSTTTTDDDSSKFQLQTKVITALYASSKHRMFTENCPTDSFSEQLDAFHSPTAASFTPTVSVSFTFEYCVRVCVLRAIDSTTSMNWTRTLAQSGTNERSWYKLVRGASGTWRNEMKL